MSNNKNYPLLPGQTHIEPYYTQEPTEEYEALKREVKQLREIMAGSRTTIDDIIEIKTLTSEVKALREMNVKAQEENTKLKAENENLKYSVATLDTDLAMERRWRKCSEGLPTPDEGYVLVLWEDGVPDIGYIGTEEDVIETVRDRGEGHSVEFWRLLPEAPEEA